MIDCPWCEKRVHLVNDICPECNHEVLPEHCASWDQSDGKQENTNDEYDNENVYDQQYDHLSIEDMIHNKFKCSKCRHRECHIKEVSMSGTGLSKLLDINYNHYLFVSCSNCGFVEIYNPDILIGHKSGKLGTILDLIF